VCSNALARSTAERALERGREERLTVAPGPLESLRLEPGDSVSVEGDERDWRVVRFDGGETPAAVLEPVSTVRVGEDDSAPVSGEPMPATGAPFLRILDLPPLINAGSDGRPVAVVAANPWRPMRVFAGPDPASLTARGDVDEPATVGMLVTALAPGVRHRWDGAGVLDIRVEGRAPVSLSASAVLAGGNTVAVETEQGWEIVQYRAAELIGGGVWRLTGLLRGQQGTEQATAAGADSGALAVFLGTGLERMPSSAGERGLPLIWRAGPVGMPAGGGGVSETVFTMTVVHDRPWSPAHLRCATRDDGGVDLSWVARSRLDGDRWEGEPAASDPLRFRIRLLDAGTPVRTIEVHTATATCSAASLGLDFPDGLDDAEAAVAQWGEGYGWGVEARVGLG
ncbi:MAG TPA: phage tail protein, partial [Brevundimonas sp.]|nr:phage tail protein [Brevundimonas sp.]